MANPIYDLGESIGEYWKQPGAGLPGGAANPVNWPGQALGQMRAGFDNNDLTGAAIGAASFAAQGAPLMGLRGALAARQPANAVMKQAMRTPRPATAIVQQQNAQQTQAAKQFLQGGYQPLKQLNPNTASTMAANRATSQANLSRLPQSAQQVLNPGVPTGLR